METRTLKWLDSLTSRDLENGAVLNEIRSVFKERDRLAHEKALLEERLANAQSNSANWDELIVATGGNVNDGMQINIDRIVKLCERVGPGKWCPKNSRPPESGFYYVGTGAKRVSIRYFDNSDSSWWLPNRKWSPNDSFSEWLLLDLKQAR